MSKETSDTQKKTLHCLSGAEATEQLLQGWQGLEGFSPQVAEGFWELLASFLQEPGHPAHNNLLEEFREANVLEGEILIGALETCDALITSAIVLNMKDTLLHEDAQVLAGENTQRCIDLVRSYASLRPALRQRSLDATLADHGKLLTGLDWRLDRVEASGRGTQLDANVLFLTLSYQEGEEAKKISLQLNEGGLRLLKSFTDRFSTTE